MFKAKALTASCVMLGLLSGCNLLTPIAFLGPHQRKVAAEFDKLEGKRTLIMVWAEPETLFDYPHIRLELATYIGDKLVAGLKDCDLVDAWRTISSERSMPPSILKKSVHSSTPTRSSTSSF